MCKLWFSNVAFQIWEGRLAVGSSGFEGQGH
jgi:hypothetical protein